MVSEYAGNVITFLKVYGIMNTLHSMNISVCMENMDDHLKLLYVYFLTVLKHKNSIRRLQIFRKMLSSQTCFSEKKCYCQLFYFEMCVLCQNVQFLFCSV